MMSTPPGDHVKQPNRETKLVCPRCGSRIRATQRAIGLSGTFRCDNDGGTFAPAPHRVYIRRTGAATA